MTESTTGLSGSDLELLSRVIALSAQSRSAGHHPFAAIIAGTDGRILAQAMNASSRDRTAHAEMNALREASARCNPAELASATLYSSAEPCAMCAGAIYWSGIGRVVYGQSEADLKRQTGAHDESGRRIPLHARFPDVHVRPAKARSAVRPQFCAAEQ